MNPTNCPNGGAASANITKRIQELGDWRGETLAHVRQLIHEADPDIQEEWKWVKPSNPGTPVWSHDGIVCTGESYKQVVKLTFARGASIKDPKRLFNSSLEGNTRRAIDLREGEKINETVFNLNAAGRLLNGALAAGGSGRAIDLCLQSLPFRESRRTPSRATGAPPPGPACGASAAGRHDTFFFRSLRAPFRLTYPIWPLMKSNAPRAPALPISPP